MKPGQVQRRTAAQWSRHRRDLRRWREGFRQGFSAQPPAPPLLLPPGLHLHPHRHHVRSTPLTPPPGLHLQRRTSQAPSKMQVEDAAAQTDSAEQDLLDHIRFLLKRLREADDSLMAAVQASIGAIQSKHGMSEVWTPICPAMHPLALCVADAEYECDGCSADIEAGESFAGCEECDYSACTACLQALMMETGKLQHVHEEHWLVINNEVLHLPAVANGSMSQRIDWQSEFTGIRAFSCDGKRSRTITAKLGSRVEVTYNGADEKDVQIVPFVFSKFGRAHACNRCTKPFQCMWFTPGSLVLCRDCATLEFGVFQKRAEALIASRRTLAPLRARP